MQPRGEGMRYGVSAGREGRSERWGFLPPHWGQHRGPMHWAHSHEHSWHVIKVTSDRQQHEEFKEGNLFHSLKGHPSS